MVACAHRVRCTAYSLFLLIRFLHWNTDESAVCNTVRVLCRAAATRPQHMASQDKGTCLLLRLFVCCGMTFSSHTFSSATICFDQVNAVYRTSFRIGQGLLTSGQDITRKKWWNQLEFDVHEFLHKQHSIGVFLIGTSDFNSSRPALKRRSRRTDSLQRSGDILYVMARAKGFTEVHSTFVCFSQSYRLLGSCFWGWRVLILCVLFRTCPAISMICEQFKALCRYVETLLPENFGDGLHICRYRFSITTPLLERWEKTFWRIIIQCLIASQR